MRLAYLVLAHRGTEQLGRLVARLGPDAPTFVHFDGRAKSAEFERATEWIPRSRFVPRHRCYWGRMGIVRGTLECIRALTRSGDAYDYAVLLSGQDYPIRPLSRLTEFLERHRGAEFIESFPLRGVNRWTAQTGPFQAMNRVSTFYGWWRSHPLALPLKRRFPLGFEPHGGSQWWCLSRPCVEWIDRFSAEHPELLRFYEHAFIPDESYLQTIIAASPFAARVAQDDLKLAIWDRATPPYPAVLTSEDARLIAASQKFFARKFDAEKDATILDTIDRDLLGCSGGHHAVL